MVYDACIYDTQTTSTCLTEESHPTPHSLSVCLSLPLSLTVSPHPPFQRKKRLALHLNYHLCLIYLVLSKVLLKLLILLLLLLLLLL